jgi:hypothetical protein
MPHCCYRSNKREERRWASTPLGRTRCGAPAAAAAQQQARCQSAPFTLPQDASAPVNTVELLLDFAEQHAEPAQMRRGTLRHCKSLVNYPKRRVIHEAFAKRVEK